MTVRATFEALPAELESRDRRAHVGLGPAGPRDRQREVWRWFQDGEVVRMEVPVAGTIRVRCGAAPWAPERPLIELPVGEDEVTLRLVAGGGIYVDVRDAPSGLPLLGELEILVECLFTGDVVARCSSAEDLESSFSPPRLAVGDYRVEVVAPGYAPWRRTDVRIDRPGARVELKANLAPDPLVGRLVLDLDPPSGGTLEGAWVHAEVKHEAVGPEGPWRTHLPRTLDEKTHTVTLTPLEPGRNQILLWAGRDLVGHIEEVLVLANETNRAHLELGAGMLVSLSELPWTPAFYTHDRILELRTRGGEALPVVFFVSRLPYGSIHRTRGWLMSKYEFRDERPCRVHDAENARARGSVYDDAVLGPYPYEELQVREVDGRSSRQHLFSSR